VDEARHIEGGTEHGQAAPTSRPAAHFPGGQLAGLLIALATGGPIAAFFASWPTWALGLVELGTMGLALGAAWLETQRRAWSQYQRRAGRPVVWWAPFLASVLVGIGATALSAAAFGRDTSGGSSMTSAAPDASSSNSARGPSPPTTGTATTRTPTTPSAEPGDPTFPNLVIGDLNFVDLDTGMSFASHGEHHDREFLLDSGRLYFYTPNDSETQKALFDGEKVAIVSEDRASRAGCDGASNVVATGILFLGRDISDRQRLCVLTSDGAWAVLHVKTTSAPWAFDVWLY
jgi:hypothetical protein